MNVVAKLMKTTNGLQQLVQGSTQVIEIYQVKYSHEYTDHEVSARHMTVVKHQAKTAGNRPPFAIFYIRA